MAYFRGVFGKNTGHRIGLLSISLSFSHSLLYKAESLHTSEIFPSALRNLSNWRLIFIKK